MDAKLKDLHEKDTVAFHRAGLYAATFFCCVPLAIVTWEAGYWPLTVLLWLVIGHVGHVNLFILHESSHYLVHPIRWVNEFQGILVGTFSLVPLSSYRYVHGRHHVYLSHPEDVEFWPYTDPNASRPFRSVCMVVELIFGYLWTPLVFLRGCLVAPKMTTSMKWRIAAEYALCASLWAGVIAVTAYFDKWEWLMVGYVIPSLLTGSMQTFRRFIEHMGLYGDTVDTATRTIDDRSFVGRLISSSMLNGDIHGPHHLHAKVPQSHLPKALDLLVEEGSLTKQSIYPDYWSATKAMLPELRDPRIGPQWLQPRVTSTASPAPVGEESARSLAS